jgi:hypothetical protein
MIPTRLGFSRSSSNLMRGIVPADVSATCWVILRIACAYGRIASMRCSARRRRAAATISIARVIL